MRKYNMRGYRCIEICWIIFIVSSMGWGVIPSLVIAQFVLVQSPRQVGEIGVTTDNPPLSP
jgi:hypothetical protein